ncbi:hypothetical protein TWF281_002289 [Arthrobotrys megalospora]
MKRKPVIVKSSAQEHSGCAGFSSTQTFGRISLSQDIEQGIRNIDADRLSSDVVMDWMENSGEIGPWGIGEVQEGEFDGMGGIESQEHAEGSRELERRAGTKDYGTEWGGIAEEEGAERAEIGLGSHRDKEREGVEHGEAEVFKDLQAPGETIPSHHSFQPLEILSQEILGNIVKHLSIPDAIRLGRASKTLKAKIVDDQHFWFKYGDKRMKRYGEFRGGGDYRGDIRRAGRGEIKSRCQICFKAKGGVLRQPLGKIVCAVCLDQNVAMADIVATIPGINMTRLVVWTGKYNIYGCSFGARAGARMNVCWLPDVKRQVEHTYGAAWAALIGGPFDNIRFLGSPAEARDRRDAGVLAVQDNIRSWFNFPWNDVFRSMVSVQDFKGILKDYRWTVRRKLYDLGLATIGQTERATAG